MSPIIRELLKLCALLEAGIGLIWLAIPALLAAAYFAYLALAGE